MKTMFKHVFTLALVFGITLACPDSLIAAGKGKKKEPEKPTPTTVSAVSESSITISTKGGSKTYPINKYATIRVHGNTAPISAVQVGMRVMVGTNSKGEAQSIAASAAPAPEKPKK